MRLLTTALATTLLLSVPSGPASAQQLLTGTDRLSFDDPEAWAMKYFASIALPTSIGAVEAMEPGSFDLGIELLHVPTLDREQRTVGFRGRKEEDLNRSPVWPRLVVTFGLPGGFSVTGGWIPPVEVDGVEGDLRSIALDRNLIERGPWSLGVRVHYLDGTIQGDLTCSAGGDEAHPPGSPQNPFGCRAPSNDTQILETIGVQLLGGLASRGGRAPAWHAGLGLNQLDMEFQVDAFTFGFHDRTRLLADGDTLAANLGATWQLGGRHQVGVELFYSPLEVQRLGQAKESDDLVHLRALWRLRVR